VTNDDDFQKYGTESVFAVVWLKIPQNAPKALVTSFSKLVNEMPSFAGRFVVLWVGRWRDVPLGKWVTVKARYG
jgi:hypothetical protein